MWEPGSNIFYQAIETNTLIWILFSSLVGAVIGGGINFFFTNMLAVSLEKSRKTRTLVKRYSIPLLLAADKLDKRLENYIRFARESWIDNPGDDYYKISTLYLMGSYFSWCHALESKTFDFYSANKTIRKFNNNFYKVHRGISSFFFLEEVDHWSLETLETASVPRLVLQAIGEIMLEEACDPVSLPQVVDYSRFSVEYYNNPETSRWFEYILQIFQNIEKSQENPYWNRLVIFSIYLRVFMRYLDPESRYTRPRHVTYLDLLHPKVAARVEKDLVSGGYSRMIRRSSGVNEDFPYLSF